MCLVKRIFQSVSVLVSLCIALLSCTPEASPSLSRSTPVPAGVEVIGIDEGEVVTARIVQKKVFDQCQSASVLNAQIRFSQSSGQESQEDLILKASGAGEVGLSPVAKVKVGSAIEARFSNSRTSNQAHNEAVTIEVPPNTRQEYTIVWQETRREGEVEYLEDGVTHIAGYSYRIGMELSSSTVVDLACDDQVAEQATVGSIDLQPTYTPYPTYTPFPTEVRPTDTPRPTSTVAPSPAPENTELSVGDWYTEGNVSIGLTDVDFREGSIIAARIPVRNVSGHRIAFEYHSSNFVLKDNLGNTYAAAGTNVRSLTLDAGETERWLTPGLCCGVFFYEVNYASTDIAELTLVIKDLSSIEYAEWTIPVYH